MMALTLRVTYEINVEDDDFLNRWEVGDDDVISELDDLMLDAVRGGGPYNIEVAS